MRLVIAEDDALLREGLALLLRAEGLDVVASVADAPGLLAAVAEHHPDVAVTDVRMPPTHTDEGIRAAVEARRRQPGLAVLVLGAVTSGPWARRTAERTALRLESPEIKESAGVV